MNESQQKAVLTASLMAAFADGSKHDRERAEIRNIAESLAGETGINLAALVQDILLKRVSLPDLASALDSPESRQLAYEMAVCVCDADGTQSPAEREFLGALGGALGLDPAQARRFSEQAESMAATPVATATAASTLSREELDKIILDAAILNGAIELLP